jgi:hypothetical protein
MANQQFFVQGTDGNLWLETGPFWTVPLPPCNGGNSGCRVQVDGNVDPIGSFQAFYSNEVFVCGSDGNLWLEIGPFGTVPLPDASYPPSPGSRTQIDGSVGVFWAWSPGEVFVLGRDGNLWLEFGFGTNVPAVPPPRYYIDGNVIEFQPVSLQEVFVRGSDNKLWQELGPFGTVPLPSCNGGTSSCRNLVDENVYRFWAVDFNHVYVIGTDGNLWLEYGPFGQQVPPERVQVDGNAIGIWGQDVDQAYVIGFDANLWLENAPFGQVPLPPCSETSGFGQGFGCRTLIYPGVQAFDVSSDWGVQVIDMNFNLWQLGTPPVLIDGNVLAFQPLSIEQELVHERRAPRSMRVKGPRFLGPRHCGHRL